MTIEDAVKSIMGLLLLVFVAVILLVVDELAELNTEGKRLLFLFGS